MRSFAPGFYTGAASTWEIAGALLTEVRHDAAKVVAEHRHEAPYFSLLLEGAYEESGTGFDLRYEPYTLVFHSAQTAQQDRILGPSRFFAVDLLPRWQRAIEELGGTRAHVFELHGGDPVWLVLRLYREFLGRDDAAHAAIEALLYELCAHVAARCENDAAEPAWLTVADAAVREAFRESPDLPALASRAGVHPTHLCRAFRRFRGQTISDAILRAKVQYVARRLSDHGASLADIAAEAGFSDQSHMTRVFKRVTGSPPGQHRHSVRA
ncbi:MAG: helix-turn-helix transcriptional regulator [Candidatus Eremiobacteraeota bacterium]|nr:helix-turn-helix transcriptional regulator [Candidatus Eremiobacteraeota bacterium]MBV9263857.1 helix-turn-helix transcriptional regulator [Candidatus Eremiobacteraeota bacterium]